VIIKVEPQVLSLPYPFVVFEIGPMLALSELFSY
jgi:hypothetical protein